MRYKNVVFVITSFCKLTTNNQLVRYKNVVFVITSFCKALRYVTLKKLRFFNNVVFVTRVRLMQNEVVYKNEVFVTQSEQSEFQFALQISTTNLL